MSNTIPPEGETEEAAAPVEVMGVRAYDYTGAPGAKTMTLGDGTLFIMDEGGDYRQHHCVDTVLERVNESFTSVDFALYKVTERLGLVLGVRFSGGTPPERWLSQNEMLVATGWVTFSKGKPSLIDFDLMDRERVKLVETDKCGIKPGEVKQKIIEAITRATEAWKLPAQQGVDPAI